MKQEMFSSKPYSSMYFQSNRFGVSLTPRPARSTDQTAAATAAAAVASLSNLMSDHRDLTNHFTLCMSQLNKTFKEAENLRQENTNLRVQNLEPSHQISLLLDAAVALSDPPSFDDELSPCETGKEKNASEIPVVEDESSKQDVETERVSLPKSISVRSNGYLKASPGSGVGSSGSSSEGKPSRGVVVRLIRYDIHRIEVVTMYENA